VLTDSSSHPSHRDPTRDVSPPGKCLTEDEMPKGPGNYDAALRCAAFLTFVMRYGNQELYKETHGYYRARDQ
jgi:hypothetical protein